MPRPWGWGLGSTHTVLPGQGVVDARGWGPPLRPLLGGGGVARSPAPGGTRVELWRTGSLSRSHAPVFSSHPPEGGAADPQFIVQKRKLRLDSVSRPEPRPRARPLCPAASFSADSGHGHLWGGRSSLSCRRGQTQPGCHLVGEGRGQNAAKQHGPRLLSPLPGRPSSEPVFGTRVCLLRAENPRPPPPQLAGSRAQALPRPLRLDSSRLQHPESDFFFQKHNFCSFFF